jgi:hypothetical protein
MTPAMRKHTTVSHAWRLLLPTLAILRLLIGAPPAVHADGPSPGAASKGLGVTLADPSNAHYLPDLHMGWARLVISWNDAEPGPEQFAWAGTDTIVNTVAPTAKLILQVAYTPAWARPAPTDPAMTPPRDPQDMAAFVAAAAARYRGRVGAYEIWNEPNLGQYWGNHKPDAAGYVALLRAIRPALRAADPQAVLVTAALALTGNRDDVEAVGQDRYLRDLYRAGLAQVADVIGMHLYGYTFAPEAPHAHPAGFYFREGEALHAVMEAMGDGARPVWVTEMGWLMQAPCVIPDGHGWQQVSAADQAAYTVRAIEYARQHWPWAGVLVVFNLDYSMVSWLGPCDNMRWRSLLNADGSPRPVFTALQQMPPAPGPGAPVAATAHDPWTFAATGTTLAEPFRAYWTAQGGLAALGYPLAPPSEEGDYLVQYTERARLEWHPENRGTAYEVLLARLGEWLRPEQGAVADGRVAGGDTAAALAAVGWPPDGASRRFAATGQTVAGPFLAVWQGGGLDRFGYPLTPARLERGADGNRYVVQWFERTRFEWHPENRGTPYEVLLARLGADLLRLWGK